MGFMCLPHGKWFLESCQSHGIWVLGVAAKKMVLRGLPNGKCVLRVRQKERGFQEVLTKKLFLGACHTENDFYGLATRKMVFRDLPHGIWILGGCHKENDF